MKQNVELTVSCNLCISCGICKGICPKSCISFRNRDGMYTACVEKSKCVNCSICLKACPGINRYYKEGKASVDVMYGKYLKVYNAWSKNQVLRHVSASGGVVSSIIEVLLKKSEYDVAFMLNTYSGKDQLQTVPFSKKDIPDDWESSSFPKSRYLPVSHEFAVRFIRENPDKRAIFVGTSCAIAGLKRVVKFLHREISQYLFIGLFCDSVFNYQVLEYFSDSLCDKRSIQAIHFKNKESGGWPGDMKLFYEDGSYEYINKEKRAEVKQFFMPESCLYCIDKLNVNADISIGDNYTDQDSSELGCNSVIIRTLAGEVAWQHSIDVLEFSEIGIEKLRKAQYMDSRLNNLYFAALKERLIKKKTGMDVHLNDGVTLLEYPVYYEQAWKQALKRINAGAKYHQNQQLVIPKSNKVTNILYRVYYRVKRSLCKE